MKQIFILFLLWFGLSLSAQDQISLLFVGDLMQHQAQIDAARQGDGYNVSIRPRACFFPSFPSYLCGFIIILIHYVFSIRIF